MDDFGATDGRAHARWTMLLAGGLSVVAQGVGMLYALGTWSEPRRSLILAAFATGVAVGALTLLAARSRLPGSLWRRPVMLAVTVIEIGVLTVAASADGGGSSPAALGFVAPMVLITVTTPLRPALPLAGMTIAAYLGIAFSGDEPPPGYILVYVTGLVLVGTVCALQARALAYQRGRLARLARTDDLTGALNRRGFEQRFRRELARAAYERTPLTLVSMDLDDFKAINDRLGHSGGDDVLRWAADALHGFLRPGDTLGRLGGDEFAVLAPGVSLSEAAGLVERLTLVLEGDVQVSVGTACHPEEATSQVELMRLADQRLYEVKRARSTPPEPADRVAEGL
jgi:diguanylate cyclase (GGDEF)-like protein